MSTVERPKVWVGSLSNKAVDAVRTKMLGTMFHAEREKVWGNFFDDLSRTDPIL